MFRNSSAFCHFCWTQEQKGNIQDQDKKDAAYISKAFSNWKKAPKCFPALQETTCHHLAAAYFLVVPECEVVGEMITTNITQIRKAKRKDLLDVISACDIYPVKE